MQLHKRAGKMIWVLSIIAFAIAVSYRVLLINRQVTDIGGVENNIIYFIQHILAGDRLYTDPQAPPYAIAQYTPLYYYTCAGIAHVAHVHADEVLKVFMVSRSVSLLLNLLYCFVVFVICSKTLGVSKHAAALASIVAFLFLDITSFSRPDSLNLFFSFLSVYFFLLYLKENEQQAFLNITCCAITSVLALATKQSALVLPILFGGWLFYENRYKHLIRFSVVYALGLIIFLLCFISNLHAFYGNVVLGIKNGISLYWFRSVIIDDFYLKYGLLFVPVAVWLFFILKKKGTEQSWFLAYALLFLFFSSNLFALKSGSHNGYFTEWWTMLIIGTAYVYRRMQAGVRPVYSVVLPLAYLIILFVKMIPLSKLAWQTFQGTAWQSNNLYASEKKLADRLKTVVPPRQYSILCNLYSPESFLNNFLFNRTVLPQYDILVFGNYKVYDYSRLKQELQTGKIRYVITAAHFNSLQLMDISLKNYIAIDTLDDRILYEYKP